MPNINMANIDMPNMCVWRDVMNIRICKEDLVRELSQCSRCFNCFVP